LLKNCGGAAGIGFICIRIGASADCCRDGHMYFRFLIFWEVFDLLGIC